MYECCMPHALSMTSGPISMRRQSSSRDCKSLQSSSSGSKTTFCRRKTELIRRMRDQPGEGGEKGGVTSTAYCVCMKMIRKHGTQCRQTL